jgi:hypothetical protein
MSLKQLLLRQFVLLKQLLQVSPSLHMHLHQEALSPIAVLPENLLPEEAHDDT